METEEHQKGYPVIAVAQLKRLSRFSPRHSHGPFSSTFAQTPTEQTYRSTSYGSGHTYTDCLSPSPAFSQDKYGGSDAFIWPLETPSIVTLIGMLNYTPRLRIEVFPRRIHYTASRRAHLRCPLKDSIRILIGFLSLANVTNYLANLVRLDATKYSLEMNKQNGRHIQRHILEEHSQTSLNAV